MAHGVVHNAPPCTAGVHHYAATMFLLRQATAGDADIVQALLTCSAVTCTRLASRTDRAKVCNRFVAQALCGDREDRKIRAKRFSNDIAGSYPVRSCVSRWSTISAQSAS